MNSQNIISTLAKKVSAGNEEICLTCEVRWSNWLAELQDLLEDSGISMEAFCGSGEYRLFVVKRDRLRLRGDGTCVNLRIIREILEAIEAES